ncbi:proteasome subunit beta type-1-like [Argopecten irradians]|uniref:proteasome subunit beta type-1-like n=1 Tax=Argopecten irradians TaxID=31199 RepID=UPI0037242A26
MPRDFPPRLRQNSHCHDEINLINRMSVLAAPGLGDTYGSDRPKEVYFNPYAQNGGTTLAVAGEDFSVIASDTRLSEGFSIHSRTLPKTVQLTGTTVLASCGFYGDVLTLTKVLKARLKLYEQDHHKKMSTTAISAMLSTMLYHKRFFPYYTDNIVAGLDNEGRGCVFSFDPVGSYERENFRAGGSASSMMQPYLDNRIGHRNNPNPPKGPLTKERAVQLIKDAFIAATERDIYTGDGVIINVITKDGVETQTFGLRND